MFKSQYLNAMVIHTSLVCAIHHIIWNINLPYITTLNMHRYGGS